MAHLTIVKCLFMIFHALKITEQTSSKMCTFKPYIDECGNRGWLFVCSKLNMRIVPRNIPDRFQDKSLAMDLSGNNFTTISSEMFSSVNIKLLQNITSLYLQFNKVKLIRKSAFGSLVNLCVLDLSNCKLGKWSLANNSFANITKLKILRIHQNAFKHLGYPDIEISRLQTLESLTIGVFEGFHFKEPFKKLTQLKAVNLLTENSKFHLTRTTFAGLSNSPIYYLELRFRNMVYSDVSEEIFCSFPVLKGVYIEFGGMCDLNVALYSLKCLQNRTMDYIIAYLNIPNYVERNVFLNKINCRYLFNTCTTKVILSRNRITGILDSPLNTRIGQCIEYLDVSVNKIEFVKIALVSDFLARYPRLQVFITSSNNYHGIVGKISNQSDSCRIGFKKRIFTLNLSKHLTILQVSNNVLLPFTVSLPFDMTLSGEGLKELYVANTQVSCKFLAPLQTPSLKILDISNNLCNEMNYPLLQFATNLEKFSASNTNLKCVDTFRMENFSLGLID